MITVDSELLLCKDCRHHVVSLSDRLLGLVLTLSWIGHEYNYRCGLAWNQGTANVVVGTKRPGSYELCSIERSEALGSALATKNSHKMCGPTGVNWLPKNTKKHLFLFLKKIP